MIIQVLFVQAHGMLVPIAHVQMSHADIYSEAKGLYMGLRLLMYM